MLITPLDGRHRRADRVLRRRRRRRLAADPHVRPAAVRRLGAALEGRGQGPEPVRRRTAATSATRATRGRRTSATPLYFLYPKVSQPGDFYGSDQTPNLLGTERTGPDLSQEVGLAPGRLAAGALLRPALHGPALADAADEVALLGQAGRAARHLRRDSGAASRACCATRASCTPSTSSSLNQGFPQPYTGFQGADKPILEGQRQDPASPRRASSRRRRTSSQIDRSYWLSGNPLPVTSTTCSAARRSSSTAASAATASTATARGPGASFLSPTAGRLHGQGRRLLRRRHRAGRLLLPHPARLARHGDGELRRPAVASTTSGASSCS